MNQRTQGYRLTKNPGVNTKNTVQYMYLIILIQTNFTIDTENA
jgi:hypothetical protein